MNQQFFNQQNRISIFLRILIYLFGSYYSEVWYNDGEDSHVGCYYHLFGFDICFGDYYDTNLFCEPMTI